MPLRVLIIEEELNARRRIAGLLRSQGHHVAVEASGDAALARLQGDRFDALCLDVRLASQTERPLYRDVCAAHPAVALVLTFGPADLTEVVEAVKLGVEHVVPRPLCSDDLDRVMERVSHSARIHDELHQEERGVEGPGGKLIGSSPSMLALRSHIARFAVTDAGIIITGESGTGKELVAQAIHASSPRSHRPLVVLNCAALPETLVETELFGHVRGAFTGATTARPGRFEAAHGGTLFLDEVGEIPMSVQAKLLRVLQERRIERIGSMASVEVDVRIVCATHRHLKQLVAEGTFREDLYYRLNVLSVEVPPLRERPTDVPALVRHFWGVFSGKPGLPGLTPRAWAALVNYPYPGNVRELEHAIHYAVVLSDGGKVDLPQLPADVRGSDEALETPEAAGRPLAYAMRGFERQCLLQALRASEGRRKVAADLLGVSRKTLWEKLRHHDIAEEEWAQH